MTVALLVSAPLGAQVLTSEREVSGTVVDGKREPLRGAVVQLENESTESVATFITDRDGHYSFKHVSTGDDYRLSATLHGHRSKSKELSKFNSKSAVTIRLVIRSR